MPGRHVKAAQPGRQVDEENKSKNDRHGLHRAHSFRNTYLCFCSVGGTPQCDLKCGLISSSPFFRQRAISLWPP